MLKIFFKDLLTSTLVILTFFAKKIQKKIYSFFFVEKQTMNTDIGPLKIRYVEQYEGGTRGYVQEIMDEQAPKKVYDFPGKYPCDFLEDGTIVTLYPSSSEDESMVYIESTTNSHAPIMITPEEGSPGHVRFFGTRSMLVKFDNRIQIYSFDRMSATAVLHAKFRLTPKPVNYNGRCTVTLRPKWDILHPEQTPSYFTHLPYGRVFFQQDSCVKLYDDETGRVSTFLNLKKSFLNIMVIMRAMHTVNVSVDLDFKYALLNIRVSGEEIGISHPHCTIDKDNCSIHIVSRLLPGNEDSMFTLQPFEELESLENDTGRKIFLPKNIDGKLEYVDWLQEKRKYTISDLAMTKKYHLCISREVFFDDHHKIAISSGILLVSNFSSTIFNIQCECHQCKSYYEDYHVFGLPRLRIYKQ